MPDNLVRVGQQPGIYYRESSTKRHNGKPDRCFYIVYKKRNKKVIREKIGWASEGYSAAMASQVRGERIRLMRHGKELPDKKLVETTFGEAWKKYDAWLETGKKHPYDDRNRYKNHIEPIFKNKELSEITTHDLEKFKDQLLKSGLSPATTKHVLVIIRQVYNKMIAWKKWSGTSPTKGLKMPRINNKRVRFLTHAEAKKLLEAIKKRSQQLYEASIISLHTGMRANEVFSLLWGHIDFDRGIIHVADPKSGKARDAYMTETIKEVLKNKWVGAPSELVFVSKNGKKVGQPSKTFLRVVKETGLNEGINDRRQIVSFHTLRHTFASWLAIQGTPILEIKELLGHATLAMTERYAHLIPDKKRESVARMEAAFVGRTGEANTKEEAETSGG